MNHKNDAFYGMEDIKGEILSLSSGLQVTAKNMLYNKEANLLYCVLDAPNKDAVEKHHQKSRSKL